VVLYYYSCSDCDGVIIKPTNANLRLHAQALEHCSQTLKRSSRPHSTRRRSRNHPDELSAHRTPMLSDGIAPPHPTRQSRLVARRCAEA